jgi:DNA-binding GntR family transcriptional regulator
VAPRSKTTGPAEETAPPETEAPATGSTWTLPADADPGIRPRDAYSRVRVAILSGELEAGRIYSQVALSDLLGVGRTPLREAIRRLQSEGLLEAEQNRRIRVSPLDPDDLHQLFAIRLPLEALAVELTVPRMSHEDVEATAEALRLHDEAWQGGDLDVAEAHHREFHFHLFAHSGGRIKGTVEELWEHAARYRRLYSKDQATRLAFCQLATGEHQGILAAARDGSAELCSRRAAQHIARVAVTLSANLDSSQDASDVRAALRMLRPVPSENTEG